jgi:hypothetical protein
MVRQWVRLCFRGHFAGPPGPDLGFPGRIFPVRPLLSGCPVGGLERGLNLK